MPSSRLTRHLCETYWRWYTLYRIYGWVCNDASDDWSGLWKGRENNSLADQQLWLHQEQKQKSRQSRTDLNTCIYYPVLQWCYSVWGKQISMLLPWWLNKQTFINHVYLISNSNAIAVQNLSALATHWKRKNRFSQLNQMRQSCICARQIQWLRTYKIVHAGQQSRTQPWNQLSFFTAYVRDLFLISTKMSSISTLFWCTLVNSMQTLQYVCLMQTVIHNI